MKPHLKIPSRHSRHFKYSRSSPPPKALARQDYKKHANKIEDKFKKVQAFLNSVYADEEVAPGPFRAVPIRIFAREGEELPVEQLDGARGFLFQARVYDDKYHRDSMIVSADKRALKRMEKRIEIYRDREGDPTGSDPAALVSVIEDVEPATIKDFWVGNEQDYPSNLSKSVWWEVWLRRVHTVFGKPSIEPGAILSDFAATNSSAITVAKNSIKTFSAEIFQVKASVVDLASAYMLHPFILELRKPTEPTERFIDLDPVDQRDLASDLYGRIEPIFSTNTAVVFLDAGINYRKPLLQKSITELDCVAWDDNWGLYTPVNPYEPGLRKDIGHATNLAGIALFPKLKDALLSPDSIKVSHRIESARILPPKSENDPLLYGTITTEAIALIEKNNPQRKRVYSLSVTAKAVDPATRSFTSSWSTAIDLAAASVEEPEARRLFIISIGNADYNSFSRQATSAWEIAATHHLEDPAQAWNAVTVGAYTDLDVLPVEFHERAHLVSKRGEVYAASRTSVAWQNIPGAPIKPEVVAEGGNLIRLLDDPDITYDVNPDLKLLTTAHSDNYEFQATGETSAATAQVSALAAHIRGQYPNFQPETIRALLVHSAKWTPAMDDHYEKLLRILPEQQARERVLRTVGYGVPSLRFASYSSSNSVTLVIESHIQPFSKAGKHPSNDARFGEMVIHDLPVAQEVLARLPENTEVEVKVTLSYFIEPNSFGSSAGRWASYPSHGLRFDFMRPGEAEHTFFSRIQQDIGAEHEEYRARHPGWYYPRVSRTRGSIHLDAWRGKPADLIQMGQIAVFPVGGWWKFKYRYAGMRSELQVPYSLVVTISVEDPTIDLYTAISQEIGVSIESQIPIEATS